MRAHPVDQAVTRRIDQACSGKHRGQHRAGASNQTCRGETERRSGTRARGRTSDQGAADKPREHGKQVFQRHEPAYAVRGIAKLRRHHRRHHRRREHRHVSDDLHASVIASGKTTPFIRPRLPEEDTAIRDVHGELGTRRGSVSIAAAAAMAVRGGRNAWYSTSPRPTHGTAAWIRPSRDCPRRRSGSRPDRGDQD